MSHLRTLLHNELTLRGVSPYTIRNYTASVSSLVKHYKLPPGKICEQQIKDFLLLKRKQGVAGSTLRNYRCGIELFYTQILKRKFSTKKITSIKKERFVPEVLSVEEVKMLIEKTEDLKTRTMIVFLYCTGIRLSELQNFRMSSIDSMRMVIKVLGKGNKQRYISISPELLNTLRIYWKESRPVEFLFENPKSKKRQYSTRALQSRFDKAKKITGIKKKGGVHMLRHSFATHLIESGTGIHVIQKLLGHDNISTTSRYLWITTHNLKPVNCPLELLRLGGTDE